MSVYEKAPYQETQFTNLNPSVNYHQQPAMTPNFQSQPTQVQFYPQQPMIINQPAIYSFNPQTVVCSNCRSSVLTKIKRKNGALSWILCGSICFAGLILIIPWFGCQFIPFCVDDCKDVEHYCPNCNTLLYIKRRLS